MHAGRRVAEIPGHIVALERARNPLAGEPYDITPTEALLWRVTVLAGEVRRLDERIAGLDEEDLTWGVVSVMETDGDAPETRTQTGARFHMLIQLRAQRERLLQSACEAAIRAGVEAAMVELARDQVAFMRRVILAALGRWAGITEDDPRIGELPEIIAAVAG
jgi:predicted TIM-barrel fold metal-dependent hydrolase